MRHPHPLAHTIIFSMFPSSSNLTVMVQQGLRLDLPSGPGCSLKYLPCSHFNPHLNTSSILGHYRESVCPARLSLRSVRVRVTVYTAAQSRRHCTQGSRRPPRATLRAVVSTCRKTRRLSQSRRPAFISVQLEFIIHDCSISVPSLSFASLTLLIQTPRKVKADHLFQ